MMESKRLERLLDSTRLFRAGLHELHQQQRRLCLESIAIMVAQADLPVSISSVKGQKEATPHFQTTGAKQWRDMDGKENIVASDTVVRGAQPSSCKASAAKGRKRKPLVGLQAANQSGQLDASSICARVVDGAQLEEDVVFQQQRGGSEELVHSVEGNKSVSLSVRGNEELVHSVEENNKSISKSVGPLRNSLEREAEDSVPNFGNTRTSRGAFSSGGKASQVKIEIFDTSILIDVDAPRLTRARARNLQNGDVNVTKARGEPPLKKHRGRKGHLKSTSISPPAEKNETAAKVQNRSPLEQQSREESPSEKPSAVKRRNTKANPEPHAVETHENVGRNGAIGEGQDMKEKLENVPPNTSRIAEEEEEGNIGRGQPSKKSRTSSGNARLNPQAEADACNLGKAEDTKAAEHLLPNAHASVDHNRRGRSSTKRSREPSTNGALKEIDGKLAKLDTVVTNENESIHRTVTDQPRTKSNLRKEDAVLAAYSSPLHSDVSTCNFTTKGGGLHSMDEPHRMDSAQADDIVMPVAQNGSASEVRIPCNFAKIIQVKEADFDAVKSLRVGRGHVHGGTDSRSESLISTEGLLKRKFSRVESPLQDSTDAGAKLSSVVSSPPLLNQSVEREVDITVLDHPELKKEGTSCIADVPAKEYLVEEDPALTECHPRVRFSDSLAKTDENPDTTRRIVAHSVDVHSLAAEPEIYETTTDATGRADVQSSAVSQTAERIDETENGMQLWSVGSSLGLSMTPQDRHCNNVGQGEFHSSPGAALELPVDVREGNVLPGQLSQTQVTDRNCTGTPVRIERQLTRPNITPGEVHGVGPEDEETVAVVPGSLKLKINEENHLFESSAGGDAQEGLNCQTTAKVSDQAKETKGELKVVVSLALDVNPSLEQEGRKETRRGLENSQMNVLGVISPVERWDRKRLLEAGENSSLVAVLSSFGSANSVSVHDHHRGDEVEFQRYTDRSCELREESELCGGEISRDRLPDREGCARSAVKGGKAVGTFVKLVEQASEPSNALGRCHMEGSASTDYASPALKNAQYGSKLRLSRLMSRKHAELSCTVADAAGEDHKYDYRRMKAPRLHEGLAPGSDVNENGQQHPWGCDELEPMDCSVDEPMPFSIDESSASLQNKKTTDLLLELWKRGGLQNSCLTAEGPSSSELHYTMDVIDEVYRSVVVRECGGNGAASSLSLPIANWSSGIVHNMIGAAHQSGARLMERGLPLGDEPDKREPTEVDSPEHRNSDQEEEIFKPSSLLIEEQEQELDTQVREVTEVDSPDDGRSDQEEEIVKPSSLLIQEQEDAHLRELTEVNSPDDGRSDQEEEIMKSSSLLIQEQEDAHVRELTEVNSPDDGRSDQEEEIMKPSSLLIQEQEDAHVRELTEVDSPDDGRSDQEEEIMKPSSLLIQEQEDAHVRELTEVDSPDDGRSDQEEEIMKHSSLLIQEQEQELDTQVRDVTEVDSPDDGRSDQEEEIMKPSSLLIQEQEDAQVREVTEVDSPDDGKYDQNEEIMKPPSLLVQEQDPDIQDSVSAFANSGFVECSQEIDAFCEASFESEQLLGHEERNMNKPMLLSRVEEEPEVSRLEDRPEDDVAVPVVNPSCNPVGPACSSRQVVSSNIGNAQSKSVSNLISSMKSFVPVSQQPAPSFLPDGKRVVKVKALIAAEAARKAEENGDVKDWRLKRARRIEENASSAMEKDETVEARSKPLKESVDESSKLDGGESSCGSQLSPKKKVLLPTRSNSRNLFSPDAKSKTNLGIENKVKKNQAELKRIEEERKRQLLATRHMKEDLARQMKEDLVKKNRQRQGILKQRKDQNRLLAEQEDKGQRHQAPEEAEREKKEMAYTQRPREKENLQGEELKLRGAGTGLLHAAGYRPGQTTPQTIHSNLLGKGSLPLRSAVRVPVISKDKRTPAIVAKAVQKKGRHPSSISSSSSKLLSLNAEPSRLPSLNAEPSRLLSLTADPSRLPSVHAQSSRVPSFNAEPARVSSMTAESAEGHHHNSVNHTFSVDNIRPGYFRQVGTGDVLPCTQTPLSEAVVKDADEGPTSYEMSPYRESDDEDDEDQPEKIIPRWASKDNLKRQLLEQLTLDPDDIFAGSKTCSLKDVFGTTGSRKVEDFGKRSGSGDWFQDRVSWKEELQYKINMGYVPRTYPS